MRHTIPRLIPPLLLVAVAITTTMAGAAEAKFDPGARAKTIAPFVDEQTFLVARVEPGKIDPVKLVEKLVDNIPEAKAEQAEISMGVGAAFGVLQQTGIKEAYMVFSIADMNFASEPMPFFIIPLKGVSLSALTPVLREADMEVQERIGDVMFVGRQETFDRVKKMVPDERPELVEAFKAAGNTTAQVLLLPPKYTARVIEQMMPELPKEIGGGLSTVITHGLRWAALGVDATPNLAVKLSIKSDDKAAATELQKRIRTVYGLVGQQKDIQEVFGDFEPIGDIFTPEVKEVGLVLGLSEEGGDVKRLLDAVRVPLENARKKARRAHSMNKLKQFALAMHVHHEEFDGFPDQAIRDEEGKPLLSWRVKILPFIGENDLYEQFHLDEPWNSEHNRTLIEKLPSLYRGPRTNANHGGRTPYVVLTGKGTLFERPGPIHMKHITDGTSRTILIVETDDEHSVIWTKPDDLAVDLEKPAADFVGQFDGGVIAAFCDGSVHFLEVPMDAEKLRAMITPAAGDRWER